MKKTMKRFLIAVVTLFAFIGIGGSIAFAMDRITWNGTGDYNVTMQNLEEILQVGKTLRSERDTALGRITVLEGEVREKNTLIEQQKETILTLENENEDFDSLISDLQTSLSSSIANVNSQNGAKQKFDSLAGGTNSLAQLLGLEERVSGDMGNVPSDDQLKQAEEDMKDVREKSDDVLDELTD